MPRFGSLAGVCVTHSVNGRGRKAVRALHTMMVGEPIHPPISRNVVSHWNQNIRKLFFSSYVSACLSRKFLRRRTFGDSSLTNERTNLHTTRVSSKKTNNQQQHSPPRHVSSSNNNNNNNSSNSNKKKIRASSQDHDLRRQECTGCCSSANASCAMSNFS